MERAGGKSVRGYNAQVVASPEQVILAAQVTQSHNDADQLEPMVAQTVEALREAGIEEGDVLAAAPLDPAARALPDRIGIEQQRHHHLRVEGRPTPAILPIGAIDAGKSISSTASSTNQAR